MVVVAGSVPGRWRPLPDVTGCERERAVAYMGRGAGSEERDPNAGQRVPIFVSLSPLHLLTTASDIYLVQIL